MPTRTARCFAVATLVLGGCLGEVGAPAPTIDTPLVPTEPPADDEVFVPVCDANLVADRPLRILTREQYGNMLRDVFPMLPLDVPALVSALPSDVETGGFASNVGAEMDDTRLGQFLSIAEKVAAEVVANFSPIMGCEASDRSCVEMYADRFGRLAYRGTLTGEQRSELLALYDGASSPARGVALLTQGMLVAADTVYHFEAGTPDGDRQRLTGTDLASKLSFFLWNSIPDATLLDAVDAGQLDSEEGLANEVDRMLATPQAEDTIAHFHREWIHMEDPGRKDEMLFPNYTPELGRQMVEETDRFVTAVLRDGGTFADLLMDPRAELTPELATLYGVDATGSGWREATLNSDERAGLLTRVGFLAGAAGPARGSITDRGLVVRRHLLCQSIPEPPADIQERFPVLPDDPNLTAQELIAIHQAEPSCAGCHALIDPIGSAFEVYDAVGAYRPTYADGSEIDPGGDIAEVPGEPSDIQGRFESIRDLSERLSQSTTARQCYAESWYRFAFYRDVGEADICSFEHVRAAFHNGGYGIEALVKGIVTAPGFRYRRTGAGQ
ncbi:MAG: DUF1592 domain-containing protein [Myxococcota bacterium]